ncbi:unnamed protein product, partial [Choristocarpus tenellus]
RWTSAASQHAFLRIEQAAVREGQIATHRWHCVGRCARKWRRVAAARGIERQAR